VISKCIIETQYFPTIAWFVTGMEYGKIYIDHAENYNKRSFRNKALLSGGGESLMLSVPLKKGKHGGKNIAEIEIANEADWQLNHLRGIVSVYGKSPYFIHFIDQLEHVLMKPSTHLILLNKCLFDTVNGLLELQMDVLPQEIFHKSSTNEIHVLRDEINIKGDFQDYEKQLSDAMRSMIEQTHIPSTVTPRSSILDLLFHLGPETRIWLNRIVHSLRQQRN